ncbi:uncharacterized protein ISCGN_022374 [Ixodes scapularis]
MAGMAASTTRAFLEYSPQGCVVAFNVGYDDARGKCGEPYSRLHALHKAIEGDRIRTGAPISEPGTLVCIASEHARSNVPLSLCDYFIGTTVTYMNDTITEANSEREPDGPSQPAKSSRTCFAASFDAPDLTWLQLLSQPEARREFSRSLTRWLREKGLCGLAVKEPYGQSERLRDLLTSALVPCIVLLAACCQAGYVAPYAYHAAAVHVPVAATVVRQPVVEHHSEVAYVPPHAHRYNISQQKVVHPKTTVTKHDPFFCAYHQAEVHHAPVVTGSHSSVHQSRGGHFVHRPVGTVVY